MTATLIDQATSATYDEDAGYVAILNADGDILGAEIPVSDRAEADYAIEDQGHTVIGRPFGPVAGVTTYTLG